MTEFAKVNEKWGMKRGTSIALSGAKHRTTEEYRRALNEECTTLEERIENNRKLLGEMLADIRFAEKRVKGLGTMDRQLRGEKEADDCRDGSPCGKIESGPWRFGGIAQEDKQTRP